MGVDRAVVPFSPAWSLVEEPLGIEGNPRGEPFGQACRVAPYGLPRRVRLFDSIRSDEYKSERLRGDLLEAETARVHPESIPPEPRTGEREVPFYIAPGGNGTIVRVWWPIRRCGPSRDVAQALTGWLGCLRMPFAQATAGTTARVVPTTNQAAEPASNPNVAEAVIVKMPIPVTRPRADQMECDTTAPSAKSAAAMRTGIAPRNGPRMTTVDRNNPAKMLRTYAPQTRDFDGLT